MHKKLFLLLYLYVLILLLVLFFVFKLPYYLVILIVGSTIIFIMQMPLIAENKLFVVEKICLVILLFFNLKHIRSSNETNKNDSLRFVNAQKEYMKFNNKIVIDLDDEFPIDILSIWQVPSKFKLNNLVNEGHFLTNTFLPTFERFNMHNTDEMWGNKNAIFIVNNTEMIEKYFKIKFNKNIIFSEVISNENGIHYRKVLSIN